MNWISTIAATALLCGACAVDEAGGGSQRCRASRRRGRFRRGWQSAVEPAALLAERDRENDHGDMTEARRPVPSTAFGAVARCALVALLMLSTTGGCLSYVKMEERADKKAGLRPFLIVAGIELGVGLALGAAFAACDSSSQDEECAPGAGHDSAKQLGNSFLWGMGTVLAFDLALQLILEFGDDKDDY